MIIKYNYNFLCFLYNAILLWGLESLIKIIKIIFIN